MQYKLYHIKRKLFIWDTIYPLNQLWYKSPELYDQYKKNYLGREHIIDNIIPVINCKLHDVVHLSPINPQKISNILKKLWHNVKFQEIFVIDIKDIDIDKAVLFDYHWWEQLISPQEIKRFNKNDLQKISNISVTTINYFKKCIKKWIDPLVFYWIPHILYKWEINIKNSIVIKNNI